MKFLISTTCIAVLLIIGYYFYNEFQSKRDAEELRLALVQQASEAQCNVWVDELNSWKMGKPIGKANSFFQARIEVENCLVLLKDTPWYDLNIKIKYW